ncbi:uncharacterized protein LOC131957687 [Physella acuta]|uniref:uncharacterized protein LOC131957687 n=1 Tax=Physella acuta TaxID=109671 RepID=UPI0027DC2A26|nr:uncharacterized protein LOC131957687 [Physella acuta]
MSRLAVAPSDHSKSLPTILHKLRAVHNFSVLAGSHEATSTQEDYKPRLDGRVLRRKNSSLSSLMTSHGQDVSKSSTSRPTSAARPPTADSRSKQLRQMEERRILARKQEVAALYRDTPLTDVQATSTDVIRYLYELWQPQLTASFRPGVHTSSSSRQDLRSTRWLVQTTPRHVMKLHRARLVIDMCHQIATSEDVSK